jgi:uncharacterized protein VirK/YbjX
MAQRDAILWEKVCGEKQYKIALANDAGSPTEGDLTLLFLQDDVWLYQISFTVTPGQIVGCAQDAVLLIGRVLGSKDHFFDIKAATRNCGDVAPPYLLMTALQSVAAALGVEMITGIGNNEQIGVSADGIRRHRFDYEAFWKDFQATRNHFNFYEMGVPFAQKSLPQIPRGHRRRARQRRSFKSLVAKEALDRFGDIFGDRTHPDLLPKPNPQNLHGAYMAKIPSIRVAP